jgi:photosystem I subunit PsaN
MACALANKASLRAQSAVAARPARRSAVVVRAEASSRRELLGLGAAMLAFTMTLAPAQAGVVDDLLAKSAANKVLNDKARLATSSANLARSRTVTDGTCGFPTNFFGCESLANNLTGGVKYIKEDKDIECAGKDAKSCASQFTQRLQ